MARRNVIAPVYYFPLLLDLLFAGVTGLLLFLAFFQKGGSILVRPYFVRVLSFTLLQGVVAGVLVLGFALLCAMTYHKLSHSRIGRILCRVIAIPFFIPSLIGCLSLVLVFGQNGIVAQLFSLMNWPYGSFLYGLCGILLIHLFYYIPFVLGQFSLALERLRSEEVRLADSLALGSLARFRIVYFPYLKKEILPSFILVFLYCLRSFTTILIFGGTPSTTTLEVSLFQALNFDLDWNVAAQICLLQLIFNTGLFFISDKWKKQPYSDPTNNAYYSDSIKLTKIDIGITVGALLFFALPMGALVYDGFIQGDFFSVLLEPEFWMALSNSLMIGGITALIGMTCVGIITYCKYHARIAQREREELFLAEIPAHMPLLFSPLIVGTIFFIFFAGYLENSLLLLTLLGAMNAFAFLPNFYRVLQPAVLAQRERFDRLCFALNLSGWHRWRFIDWRAIKSSFGYCLGSSFIVSLGDAKGILFFNQSQFPTLISLIYQKMHRYQFNQAASISAWLIMSSFLIYVVIQRIFGKHAK